MKEFLTNPLVQYLITTSLSLISVIATIVVGLPTLLPYLKRNSQNKGMTDEHKQIASASRTRPFFSVLAVLLFFMAAVVGILHLVGIVVSGWSIPLVIVMITAAVVFVILQWRFRLGSSREDEDVAYKSWFNDFNKQLASSDTGALVIRGYEKWRNCPVFLKKENESWENYENKPRVYFGEGDPSNKPFYVAIFKNLMPDNYDIRMRDNFVTGSKARKCWPWYRDSTVTVLPGQAAQVDLRKVKPDCLTER